MIDEEQPLLHSEQRFRQLADALPLILWTADASGEVDYINEAFSRFLGHERASGDPAEWPLLVHPDDRARSARHWRWCASRCKPYVIEYRLQRADDAYRWHRVNAVPVRDADGAVSKWYGVAQDIDEQRRSEERATEQAALLDQAHDAILVLDADCRIQYWNQGGQRLYGWSADDMLGQSLATLTVEADAMTEALATVRSQGEWRGRLLQRCADGSTVTVEGRWVQVNDRAGAGTGADTMRVVAIHNDVTERLALEEQLRQAQRLESVGQLTGGIAHDFNNLLTIMLGNADLLVEQVPTESEAAELVAMIQSAAERASDLTSHLLAFARRQRLDPRAVDLERLLAGTRRLLRRTLGEQIRVQVTLDPGVWQAFVDPSQLEHALLNMCLNARDAMPGGGDLFITTRNRTIDAETAAHMDELAAGDYVEIVVTDTGQGMDPVTRSHAFDPFFTTKEVGQGSGLGLSMVYGFVKQSRGHVSLHSMPGQGTSVHLLLPRAEGVAAASNERSTARLPRGRGERVLLVEDDALVCAHLAALLTSLGYQTECAGDAEQALARLEASAPFDLLLTDIVMPGAMDGVGLARTLQSRSPELPVVLMTGYPDDAFHLDPAALRHWVLLTKPYRHDSLARVVRALLDGEPVGV